MSKTRTTLSFAILTALLATACDRPAEPEPKQSTAPAAAEPAEVAVATTPPVEPASNPRFDIYTPVELSPDISHLSDNQRQVISLLIDAAKITDDLFWQQVWGDKDALLEQIEDPAAKRFAVINYGPWDRLDDEQTFLEGYGERPPGANMYPKDMTREEFEAWDQPDKDGQYSLVRRDDAGNLVLVPYATEWAGEMGQIATKLREAAELAEDEGFANYLRLRADALLSDDYQPSDMAWMDMKDNDIELVIGPIEHYQDALFGYRAAFETFVLVKDQAWSERLARFAQHMPVLQEGLPVAEEYKAEMPGSDADLNAYDVAYVAGDANSGSKTIAINLPNDEEVQLAKGTRRLQLKNAMRAKYDKILEPIADELIAPDQRQYITFDAFFGNTMFHEVAHGLGIKTTLDGAGTVRAALKEHASALEEGKADILGLYMVQRLREMGEITEGEVMDNYVTFLAGIFRSVRFGASSAHGRANMIRFNYFAQAGAFERNDDGQYRVNVEAFEAAVESLSRKILTLQGDGDYDAVATFVAEMGNVSPLLQADLDRLSAADIPVDIVYEQGKAQLGLGG
ncbi:Zn-dependent hydrolase [Marinihelvus fidelis]|uniref:Zn-dependent hydrolase n=1 Tax=Marinihelvus fidelis TaxID=2613842 RepID=A0A5N0TH90_9GAMM|nr:Zn-dependent hydrolase [Marinihelvus fidelis]KAA9133507.1 Zn-dependent hydrolase [Marinihelvus fidelis]